MLPAVADLRGVALTATLDSLPDQRFRFVAAASRWRRESLPFRRRAQRFGCVSPVRPCGGGQRIVASRSSAVSKKVVQLLAPLLAKEGLGQVLWKEPTPFNPPLARGEEKWQRLSGNATRWRPFGSSDLPDKRRVLPRLCAAAIASTGGDHPLRLQSILRASSTTLVGPLRRSEDASEYRSHMFRLESLGSLSG